MLFQKGSTFVSLPARCSCGNDGEGRGVSQRGRNLKQIKESIVDIVVLLCKPIGCTWIHVGVMFKGVIRHQRKFIDIRRY